MDRQAMILEGHSSRQVHLPLISYQETFLDKREDKAWHEAHDELTLGVRQGFLPFAIMRQHADYLCRNLHVTDSVVTSSVFLHSRGSRVYNRLAAIRTLQPPQFRQPKPLS